MIFYLDLTQWNLIIRAMHDQGLADVNLFDRLFKTYPKMMIKPNLFFGLHSFFCILISILSIKFYNFKRILFLILWSFLPWLYLNFGTTSFSTYFTLPASPRYIMFVYSPIFLLTGAVISKIIANKRKLVVAILLFAGITVLSGVVCGYLIKGTGYSTEYKKALKLIVNKAEKYSLRQCVILSDEEDKWRWQKTIEILSNFIRVKGI